MVDFIVVLCRFYLTVCDIYHNGKYCCNMQKESLAKAEAYLKFQYRKR